MADFVELLEKIWSPARATSRLLEHLVESQHEHSLTDLARTLGISAMTATREADRLAAVGLLRDHKSGRERLVAIDPSSPFYKPVADLMYVARGVRPRPQRLTANRAAAYQVRNFAVLDLIPAHLRAPQLAGPAAPNASDAGPALTQVRATVLKLWMFTGRACETQGWLQASYRVWHDERDRDLVHLTLNAGAGFGQAADVLSATVDHRRDLPPSHPIDVPTWEHACHAVRAEAAICGNIADHLEDVITHAETLHRARLLIAEKEQLVAANEGVVADAFQSELDRCQAEAATAESALQGKYRYGGLSTLQSVGTAGERLIAVEFRHVAEQATQLAAEMERFLPAQLSGS